MKTAVEIVQHIENCEMCSEDEIIELVRQLLTRNSKRDPAYIKGAADAVKNFHKENGLGEIS